MLLIIEVESMDDVWKYYGTKRANDFSAPIVSREQTKYKNNFGKYLLFRDTSIQQNYLFSNLEYRHHDIKLPIWKLVIE